MKEKKKVELSVIIHTVKENESLGDIAKEYEVSRESIKRNNGLAGEKLCVGEELLIIVPTRTYRARYGDTAERICLRFGIRKNDLYSMNPTLSETGIREGDTLALRYGTRNHGMAASAGYFFSGCSVSALKRALPYLTYVAVGASSLHRGKIKRLFDGREAVKTAKEHSKIPLLRIFKEERGFGGAKERADLIDEMIGEAKSGGYMGIDLAGLSFEKEDELGEFLIEMRKALIGSDLILITECNSDTPHSASELSDASLLYYPKYAYDKPQSYETGEKSFYSDFASKSESAKTFIDLPALAVSDAGYLPVEEALRRARGAEAIIERNEDTLLCEYKCPRGGICRFTSLKNIKATLGLLCELGFMGIGFDIMRSPISHLAMYNALFKTVSR